MASEPVPAAESVRKLEDGGRVGFCDYCDSDPCYTLPAGNDTWMCDECVLECLPRLNDG